MITILDTSIPIDAYCPIDLSVDNLELKAYDISNPLECQEYVSKILQQRNALVAFGGYLEERNLYRQNHQFSTGKKRNIHLGVDFWCAEGTKVICPLEGRVHSFQNNKAIGDYGPTIILEHNFQGSTFYSLFGHLSLDSISGLYQGKPFKKGQVLAELGDTSINVNYAPHLHLQLIRDLGNNHGDYPGVCAKEDLAYYQSNCPDPIQLFSSIDDR